MVQRWCFYISVFCYFFLREGSEEPNMSQTLGKSHSMCSCMRESVPAHWLLTHLVSGGDIFLAAWICRTQSTLLPTSSIHSPITDGSFLLPRLTRRTPGLCDSHVGLNRLTCVPPKHVHRNLDERVLLAGNSIKMIQRESYWLGVTTIGTLFTLVHTIGTEITVISRRICSGACAVPLTRYFHQMSV